MNTQPGQGDQEFAEEVAVKEARKLRARRRRDRGLWYGLGMFGLVGWSVALPTLAGLALGIWIDTRFETAFSWTLMMLVAGIATGCANAWYWVRKEGKHE